MAKAKKKTSKAKDEDKVFDVAKPGKGKTDIGSKPMIVGHKSMAADPMVREEEAEKKADQVEEKITQTSKVKIEPLSDDLKKSDDENAEVAAEAEPGPEPESKDTLPTDDAADTSSEKEDISVKVDNILKNADEEEKSEPKSEATPKEEPEKEKPADAESEPAKDEGDSEPASDSDGEEEGGKEGSKDGKDKELDPAAVEMEREENLRRIIDSKKYHLNIKEKSSTPRSTKLLSIVILVLLVLGGAFYLIDSKTIDNNIELPFSIFGEDEASETTPEATVETPAEQTQEQQTEQPAPEKTAQEITEEVESVKNQNIAYLDESLKLTSADDLANLPEGTPESFRDFLTQRLATLSTEASECTDPALAPFEIQVDMVTAEFIRGGEGQCIASDRIVWYLANGQWESLGFQDILTCSQLVDLKIPKDFIAVCLSDEQKAIENPNERYAPAEAL